MKEKIRTVLEIVMVVAIIGLVIYIIYQHKHKDKYFPSSDSSQTDTVYVDKPLEPTELHNNVQVPDKVTIYRVDTLKIQDILIIHDTVYVHTTSRDTLWYNSKFITQFQNSPKLLQLELSGKELDISTMTVQGIVEKQSYKVYPKIYGYFYQDNTLTYESRNFFQRLEISAEMMVRPINNLWDLNLGIGYKTRNFNYEFGLNMNYYPKFRSELGLDPFLRVRYTF